MEETAIEFDIQGLELDWTIMCWDANLRFNGTTFENFNFNGTKWQHVNKEEIVLYLKNAYRVLLTRARQGFVIFVPEEYEKDITRKPEYYNGVYNFITNLDVKVYKKYQSKEETLLQIAKDKEDRIKRAKEWEYKQRFIQEPEQPGVVGGFR